MQFRCEDLAQAGIVLIPHNASDFRALLTDITSHIESPPPGSPPAFPNERIELPDPDDPASAILWNQSGKPLCGWTRIWKPGGITVSTTGFPSLLLPFGLREDRRAFETYWHTILPNSKRWLSRRSVLGSNADVRPPSPEEVWVGGVVRFGGGAGGFRGDPDAVSLTIDAAFFATGECVGPDTRGLWNQIVPKAELCQQAALSVRRGVRAGTESARILSDVEKITGTALNGPPPPPPPPSMGRQDSHEWHENARQELARRIADMRRRLGDEKTVSTLDRWADATVPQFRRIAS